MMIDLLAGPLIGEVYSAEAGRNDNGDGTAAIGGELIVAFDPKRLGGGDRYLDHAEELFAEMYAQDGVRLPGDRRLAARKRTPDEGVQIPKALYDTILELAAG